ncbi:MAG: restriction endonuclease [Candidatus Kaistia colombiensis]|nr:MAG: restriction endonuclease [Kaistia sp.]
MAIARDIARQQRHAEMDRNRRLREAERHARSVAREAARAEREQGQALRLHARTLKEREREERVAYLREREDAVADLNVELEDRVTTLANILSHTLSIDDTISFDSLKLRDKPPAQKLPAHLKLAIPEPEQDAFIGGLQEPRGLKSLIPGARRKFESALDAGRAKFRAAMEEWTNAEERRRSTLSMIEREHLAALEMHDERQAKRNAEVDIFQTDYLIGDPDAIVAYHNMVLERSNYPDDFPHAFSVAYTSSSRQLVVQYELPSVSSIPTALEYRYVKATDSVSEKPHKQADIKISYQELIASVALRTIHEIFESDQASHIDAVCFNGFIRTIDPATGKDIQPHLISVRTSKERFSDIDLARVDKRACLKNLGAQVSSRPDEAQAVKPIVEFQMADARFIDQSDLISALDSATNLMELNPYEFEQLVANLFGQMGLESKLTRSSRDGGVDCVAYDARPVLGGKVVIQAKRYRNTVGVSAVRDLFGTR